MFRVEGIQAGDFFRFYGDLMFALYKEVRRAGFSTAECLFCLNPLQHDSSDTDHTNG